MDASGLQNTVQALRGSSEDSSSVYDEHFKATLDALLEGDSDSSDPLKRASATGRSGENATKLPPPAPKQPQPAPQVSTPTEIKQQPQQPQQQFTAAAGLSNALMSFLSDNAATSNFAGIPQEAARASVPPKTDLPSPADVGASISRKRTRSHLSSGPPLTTAMTTTKMQPIPMPAISEDEGDREKRRQDRNNREKQRSQQITHQISILHDILVQANIDHKTDKFSTLSTVENYIKDLQKKTQAMAVEHKNLLETMIQASQLVQESYIPVTTDSKDEIVAAPVKSSREVDSGVVGTLDFQSIFSCCPCACSVANIDGRFVDVNSNFETFTGYSRKELLESPACPGESGSNRNMSIFNMVCRDDMESMFKAMSDMLRRPMVQGSEMQQSSEDNWTNLVHFAKTAGNTTRLSISLVRSNQGCPRFFICVLLPVEGQAATPRGPPSEIRISSANSDTSSSDSLNL